MPLFKIIQIHLTLNWQNTCSNTKTISKRNNRIEAVWQLSNSALRVVAVVLDLSRLPSVNSHWNLSVYGNVSLLGKRCRFRFLLFILEFFNPRAHHVNSNTIAIIIIIIGKTLKFWTFWSAMLNAMYLERSVRQCSPRRAWM